MPSKKREQQRARREAAQAPSVIEIAPELLGFARAAAERWKAANNELEIIRLRTLMAQGITNAEPWNLDLGGVDPVIVYQTRRGPRPADALPLEPPAEPPPVGPTKTENSDSAAAHGERVRLHFEEKVADQMAAAAAEGGS